MAQECGFFNAELEGSEYDRVYNAEQFAAYFASFIANGVFGNSMGELVVLENQQANMSVDVSSGQGWINGWWYRNTEELNLPIALADGILNRKDIVVLRWGNAERDMWLQVIQGEPSGEPIAPSIVRNADYYDLKLCEISIPAGTSRITQSLITDTRLDNNVCGLVTGVVQQIDTTQLFIQFQAAYADWKNIQEADYESWTAEQQQDYNTWITTNQNAFVTWFNHMKDQLDSDAAGHLQNEIDDLQDYVDEGFDNIELKRFVGENFAEAGTKEGSALAHTIYGMSVQEGTPTPTSPVDIVSALADFKCVGKNLIPYPYGTYQNVINGVTFTTNPDGTITANGTATANTQFYFHFRGNVPENNPLVLVDGHYHLSGCPSGGAGNTYELTITKTINNEFSLIGNDKGNGLDFELSGGDYFNRKNTMVGCVIQVHTGYTANNLVFKPMITLANVSDSDYAHYEPYKVTAVTTDLTLRAIEVSSTDDYNLVRDGKYYIADTVDWSEDRGYEITRRVGHVVIDGSTSIASISGNTVQIMHTAFSQMRANLNVGYSNRFAHKSSNYTTGGDANTGLSSGEFSYRKGQVTTTANQRSIYLKNSDFTTTSNASIWFASNNTNITFVLETPTTEPITSEQAQALLSLKTYDEATSISATGDIEPSLDLEYSKSEMGAKALTGHNEGFKAQELEGKYGVKNLNSYPYYNADTFTTNGVTFTCNSDGSVIANGTATADACYALHLRELDYNKCLIPLGSYILSGCPGESGYNANCCIRLAYTKNGSQVALGEDRGSGLHFVIEEGDDYYPDKVRINLLIYIRNGYTANNLLFKPMIRSASFKSDEYEQYAMSNYELTKKVQELQAELNNYIKKSELVMNLSGNDLNITKTY